MRPLRIAVVLLLVGGHAIAEDGFSIVVNFRDAKGGLLDSSWASLLRVSLAKAAAKSERWLAAVPGGTGSYELSGEGAVCEKKACDAEWEIRAQGFVHRFKMRDHCATWRGDACYAVELDVPLDDCRWDACVGGICERFHSMQFDLRNEKGRRLGCEFDLVSPDSPPVTPSQRKLWRKFGRHPVGDGTCESGGGGAIPLGREYEIRADGLQPLRFRATDYCIDQNCGKCGALKIKARLKAITKSSKD